MKQCSLYLCFNHLTKLHSGSGKYCVISGLAILQFTRWTRSVCCVVCRHGRSRD